MTVFDVIVCGAGPAGTTAARGLAREGFRVLLLEKEKLPRRKLCGGGLTLRALDILDPPLPGAEKNGSSRRDGRGVVPLPPGAEGGAGARLAASGVIERWVRGAHCRVDDGNWTAADGDGPVVAMAMRARLDAFLAEDAAAAGALVRDGIRVTAVEERENAVEVRTRAGSFRALYLAAADGAVSTVARRLGLLGRTVLHPAMGTELLPRDGSIDEAYRDMALYDLGAVRGGYAWAFPKKDRYSVGLSSIIEGDAAILRERLRLFIDRHPFLKRCRPGRIEGWFLPLSRDPGRIASSRTILIGDAAGCVDPFTGEGISHAARSGALAAAFLAKKLREGAGPGLASFRTLLDREIFRDLRFGRFLGRLFYRFPRLAFRIVLSDPRAVKRFTSLMSGKSGYRDILKLALLKWYRLRWFGK